MDVKKEEIPDPCSNIIQEYFIISKKDEILTLNIEELLNKLKKEDILNPLKELYIVLDEKSISLTDFNNILNTLKSTINKFTVTYNFINIFLTVIDE